MFTKRQRTAKMALLIEANRGQNQSINSTDMESADASDLALYERLKIDDKK